MATQQDLEKYVCTKEMTRTLELEMVIIIWVQEFPKTIGIIIEKHYRGLWENNGRYM
jgi:hypothetical protein